MNSPSQSNILNEIKYLKVNIGYFPRLNNFVKHGFSWGNQANMSSKNKNSNAKKNIQYFFDSIELTELEDSLVLLPDGHKDNIVFVNEGNLDLFPKGKIGIPISCDALFTNIQALPISIRVADCTTAILYAKTFDNIEITGIVHTGRRSAELLLAKKSIDCLVKQQNVNLETIKIGIVPSISKVNYKSQNLENIQAEVWGSFISKEGDYFEVDILNFVINQYLDAGISPDNIEVYEVDTYESAKNKLTFSHRYYSENKDIDKNLVDGRFIVATSLY
ncbi:polyphenol oxidase family protein [bacterium]|nr:MAG: polyphenol oxidase family protein [bacterium]